MIDYEFTIRRLEKELSHYREMQQIQDSHLDAHDRGMEALQQIATATREDIRQIVEAVKGLTVKVDTLTTNVNTLVEALLRDHKNGKAA
jgi:hypothetical protein